MSANRRTGFAAMTPERVREIGASGGRAKRGHRKPRPVSTPITEEDVRRIVREEMRKHT